MRDDRGSTRNVLAANRLHGLSAARGRMVDLRRPVDVSDKRLRREIRGADISPPTVASQAGESLRQSSNDASWSMINDPRANCAMALPRGASHSGHRTRALSPSPAPNSLQSAEARSPRSPLRASTQRFQRLHQQPIEPADGSDLDALVR